MSRPVNAKPFPTYFPSFLTGKSPPRQQQSAPAPAPAPGPQQQAAATQAPGPGQGQGLASNSTQKIQDAINAAKNAAKNAANAIQTGFDDIYNNTTKNDVKDGVVLFLQVVESTATLIPIFGPVVVLGAQIIELRSIRNEVKETLLDFVAEINSYSTKIGEIFQILTTYFLGKIQQLNFFTIGTTSHSGYQQLNKSVKEIKDLNTKITTSIEKSKKYLNKLIVTDNSAISNMKARSWFTSTTTISSRVNTLRISIINNIILFLFEIDLVFFTALDGIMEEMNTNLGSINANLGSINANISSINTSIDSTNATMNTTIGSVALSTDVIEELTQKLNKLVENVETNEKKIQILETSSLNKAKQTVNQEILENEPPIMDDDDDDAEDFDFIPEEINSEINDEETKLGGYKFKSKKIKRKLNKIKRKTKNNRKTKNKRKTKNNRKTKKYI